MSDFLNPLGGRFIGPSGPVATSAVAGTIPDPPRALRQLDPGTIIKGVVLGRESDGLTAIATDKGTVRVASNAVLPAGAQVTLEVRPAGDRLQVLILSNDAIQRGAAHTAPAPASTAGAQAPQTAAGQPTVTPSTTQTAQPPALPATSAPGPDARGPDPRAADARAQQSAPATTTPTRSDQPSIQFVGASLRAVVVQAPPAQTQTQPAPTTPQPPVPPQPAPAQSQPAAPGQTQTPPVPLPPVQQSPVPSQPAQQQPVQPQSSLPAQRQAASPTPAQILPAPPRQPSAPAAQQSVPPQPPSPGASQSPPAPSVQVVQQPPAPPQPTPPQSQPVSPAPTLPTPVVAGEPIPTPIPPAQGLQNQLPPLPTTAPPPAPVSTQPIPTNATPAGTVPTAPVPPAPVATTPVQPLPQGLPIPNVGTGLQQPSATTNAATLQAALIVANAEKKDKSGQPASSSSATPPRSPMALPPEIPPTLSRPIGGSIAPGTSSSASFTSPVPTGTALTEDARLRILALFASAGVTPEAGHLPSAIAEEDLPAQASKIHVPPLPLGAELKLRVLAVQMQANQAIEIDPIGNDHQGERGQVIFGRVVAITPAGHAVIHTPVGDIMLQNRSSLVLGASLALVIDTLEAAAPPAAIAAPIVQTPQQALLSLSQSWPTLADLIAIFQGASAGAAKTGALDPDIARQALAMLPHAGNKLGAGMMNAMAALRSGDIGKLLGTLFAAKGAGAEREETVRRLRGEFAQLSALAQERPEVEWRALFLPIIDHQGRVNQVNLFYRRPKKDDGDDRAGGAGTRFVVEADFSRLGPFQLDGLMRQQRFDLMIRSRTRLTDRMRLDIEAIYEEARGLTGFTGSLAFQTVAEFPVIPLDDLKRSAPTVMV